MVIFVLKERFIHLRWTVYQSNCVLLALFANSPQVYDKLCVLLTSLTRNSVRLHAKPVLLVSIARKRVSFIQLHVQQVHTALHLMLVLMKLQQLYHVLQEHTALINT